MKLLENLINRILDKKLEARVKELEAMQDLKIQKRLESLVNPDFMKDLIEKSARDYIKESSFDLEDKAYEVLRDAIDDACDLEEIAESYLERQLSSGDLEAAIEEKVEEKMDETDFENSVMIALRDLILESLSRVS